MCKPISEGGQRCAAHTRPKYEAATLGTVDWDEAAAAYASTPSGRRVLGAELDAAQRTGDIHRAVAFERAIRFGDQQREVAKAVRAAIQQARQDASDPLGINRAWERHEDNKALGRGQYEYDDDGNVVFDPYEHDGNTAPGGTASHMGSDEMAAWVAGAPERKRIYREFWIGSARRNPDNARRTLEATNPELAAKFDWTTGTYIGDDHVENDVVHAEGAEDASVSRLTAEGRALYDQAVAAGVPPPTRSAPPRVEEVRHQ